MKIPFLVTIYSSDGYIQKVCYADNYDEAHDIAASNYELDDIDDIEEFSQFEHGDPRTYKSIDLND